MRKFLLIPLVCILLCTSTSSDDSVSIFFCPEDDCEELLASFINSADDVSCAFYSLRSEKVAYALANKSARVVLNGDMGKTSKYLLIANITRLYYSDGLMHNKFCVADGKYVWTGSYNPRPEPSWDNVLVISSRHLAQNYLDEFEELWNRKPSRTKFREVRIGNTIIRNLFCPEDDCLGEVVKELRRADSFVLFAAYTFTSREIAEELSRLQGKSVQINCILEIKTDLLENVSKKSGAGYMHNKFLVIDNKTVITGSPNPTNSGFYSNDENILIIHGEAIAESYARYFGDMWEKS